MSTSIHCLLPSPSLLHDNGRAVRLTRMTVTSIALMLMQAEHHGNHCNALDSDELVLVPSLGPGRCFGGRTPSSFCGSTSWSPRDRGTRGRGGGPREEGKEGCAIPHPNFPGRLFVWNARAKHACGVHGRPSNGAEWRCEYSKLCSADTVRDASMSGATAIHYPQRFVNASSMDVSNPVSG